jgi:hypothetical protein
LGKASKTATAGAGWNTVVAIGPRRTGFGMTGATIDFRTAADRSRGSVPS